jgi:predicted nucleic acid-binding protein
LNIYADTSFFISVYLPDQHSPEAQRRLAQQPLVWLTPLHLAEWTHAIALLVFRNKVSTQEAQQVYRNFERDRLAGVWVEVDLPAKAFEVCARLARHHVASLGVRTLDTLHVASALELVAQSFWTFDARQANLARVEGLKLS